MKDKNVNILQRLSSFCRYVGIISVLLAVVIIFIDIVNQDWIHMQAGIFIFASGYAFTKIGGKISQVLFDERTGLK